jgi:hypothetical protein
MPAQLIAHTLPVTGIGAAMLAGAGFTALVELAVVHLRQIDGLSPPLLGAVLATQVLGMAVALWLITRMLPTRWFPVLVLGGLLTIAAAGALLALAGALPAVPVIALVGVLLGLGAGAAVGPGCSSGLSASPLPGSVRRSPWSSCCGWRRPSCSRRCCCASRPRVQTPPAASGRSRCSSPSRRHWAPSCSRVYCFSAVPVRTHPTCSVGWTVTRPHTIRRRWRRSCGAATKPSAPSRVDDPTGQVRCGPAGTPMVVAVRPTLVSWNSCERRSGTRASHGLSPRWPGPRCPGSGYAGAPGRSGRCPRWRSGWTGPYAAAAVPRRAGGRRRCDRPGPAGRHLRRAR